MNKSFLKTLMNDGTLVSHNNIVWGTLVIAQISDFQFLADLHVSGFWSKKHKISMVSGCSS